MTKLQLDLSGETGVIVTRRFSATPAQVYRAHTDPAIIPRWMTGPDGWSLPHCVSDARPGGAIRFEWSDGQGNGFHLTGEYLEVEPAKRTLHVERMFLPDPTPDNRVETTFEPSGTGTLLTLRMTLPDASTREAMLATGMADGMEQSYARLEALDLA